MGSHHNHHEEYDNTFLSPSSANYFYGRLSRAEAEAILKKHQPVEGMFLLREFAHDLGNYAISIFSRNKFYHYPIKRTSSNNFALGDNNSVEFSSPVMAIDYIKNFSIPVKPVIPCNREPGINPIRYLFVSEESFQDALTKVIRHHCKKEYERELARGQLQYKYEYLALKELHLTQKWFKAKTTKEEIDKLYKNARNRKNGCFILRTNYTGKYRLAIFSEKMCDFFEYKIVHDNKTYFIKGSAGEDFRCIVELIDFYGRVKGYLNHKLTEPCIIDSDTPFYSSNAHYRRLLSNDVPSVRQPSMRLSDNHEPIECDNFTLVIGKPLGSGNYSDVYHGIFSPKEENGRKQEVAVKIFKKTTEEDMKREEIMLRSLEHDHIVKLIDNTENLKIRISNLDPTSTQHALIMEYAMLGSLRSYLPNNEMSVQELLVIAKQVADALKYLASKGKVHRDIALRNILLFSRNCAKLSDFGLSKDLDKNDYYNSSGNAAIPLKWYPPESVLHNKFSEKSDVWSYGVMLWQAFSKGALPFEDIKNHEFQDFLSNLETRNFNKPVLNKPKDCPTSVYKLITKCLNVNKDLRPNFIEICDELDHISAGILNEISKEVCDVESIGKGYFSDVFKIITKNTVLETELAVKVCRQLNLDLKDQEFNTLKALEHPHIIKVLDPPENIELPRFLYSLGDPVLFMEYAKLGTFKEYLKVNDLEALEILLFMSQICDALIYMVSKNMVHRDVAARNILIFSENCAKLSDVGLTRLLDDDYYYRSSGNQPIPLKWYPPESIGIYGERNFTEKSDVWSFGITLWEAFSNGATPFQEIKNNKFLEYMKTIDDDTPKLMKPHDCPESVYKIIEKCIRVNKSERPTFVQIKQELESATELLKTKNQYINDEF